MRSLCEKSLGAVRGGILVNAKKSADGYYEVFINTERDFNCAIAYLRSTQSDDVIDAIVEEYNIKKKSNFSLSAKKLWNFREFCRGKCTFLMRG